MKKIKEMSAEDLKNTKIWIADYPEYLKESIQKKLFELGFDLDMDVDLESFISYYSITKNGKITHGDSRTRFYENNNKEITLDELFSINPEEKIEIQGKEVEIRGGLVKIACVSFSAVFVQKLNIACKDSGIEVYYEGEKLNNKIEQIANKIEKQ